MLYSSALVLGTMAVGQAAAANVRHASFHARRNVPRQPEGEKINFDALVRDTVDYAKLDWASILKTVDFKTINYGPTPTPVAQQPSSAPVATPSASPSPSPSQAPSAPSSPPEAAKPSVIAASTNPADIFEGVAEFSEKKGIAQAGISAKASTGDIRLGAGGPLTVKHINNNGATQFLFCWKSAGYTGMTVNVSPPAIAVKLPIDGTPVITSHAEAVPFACATLGDDGSLGNFGGVDSTWFEAEYMTPATKQNGVGAFDISRLVNTRGPPISAKGSKCTANFSQCYYYCLDSSVSSCGAENSYGIANCNASNGGGSGYNNGMKGMGGGCAMSTNGEEIEVRYG